MNNVYEMEWPVLSSSDKRALLLIMKRATDPIEFSSAYIITMNLDSFVAVSINQSTRTAINYCTNVLNIYLRSFTGPEDVVLNFQFATPNA